MTPNRVLIIDDDISMRNSLQDLAEAAGWIAKTLARATDVQRWLTQFQPDVILSDVRMPEVSGLELLKNLEGAPPIVLISAHGDIPTAVEAMNQGAYSFVEKPFDPKRILLILAHAAEQHQMRESNLRLKERLHQLSGIDRVLLGRTPAINRVRETISMVAGSETSVLVQGETGTGKDLVARAVHDLSPRCDGPFIAVNAAQLGPENLFDVAATASRGTLFLDEICACPTTTQPLLLRLIDSGDVLDADGKSWRYDLRIVSATNEDLDLALAEGRMRKDLLFRLSGFVIDLPPLRARLDDISLLASRFLNEFATQYNTDAPDLSESEISALLSHDWPGNVRELRNALERRVILGRVSGGDIHDVISGTSSQPKNKHGLREAVASLERQLISKAIQAHGGRMDEVASVLGIGRRTLNEKIVKLGLDKNALL